ncbi:MAG: lipid asymmetry maintenance protein MlaB [Gammaproteobacteria bacterium]
MNASAPTSARQAVRLQPELTIYAAAATRALLLDAMAQARAGGALLLDLSEVCEIDSAGMQLLAAARRSAEQAGLAFALLGHSAAVQDAFALYGLALAGPGAQATPTGDAP